MFCYYYWTMGLDSDCTIAFEAFETVGEVDDAVALFLSANPSMDAHVFII